MDLAVVGRHALFFDDDTNAAFVNSRDALVEWNSLFIDRYDVRHLLPNPLPPFTRRRHLTRSSSSPPPYLDGAQEFELDQERYLDLASPSEEQEQEQDAGNDSEQAEAGGFHSVGFSYGNPDEFTEQKNKDTGPVFCPTFPVPESLLQNLPPTKKIHQIIARTARFVAMHGGQSEIILRVKQGDNPKMGFLMPDHHLHAYFRFLVDHQELLEYGTGGKTLDEEKKAEPGLDQTGGALSLLGSVYGSGEDEDGVIEDAPELRKLNPDKAVYAVNASVPSGSEHLESSGNVAGKNDFVSKSSCMTTKEKVNVIKHNRTVIVNSGAISGMKKESSALGPLSTAAKSQAPAIPSSPKVELPILEPPSDQKRVVDKIVEFILKNGREFEAVLVEQNCKHGRFLFLMPSDQYHPYYLKVLQQAQESKISGKGLVSEKHQSVHVADRKTAEEGGAVSSGSAGHDFSFDNDKKEKFKMVIGKSKKDGLEPPSKAEQPQPGVSLDAAAAILQAATRGIKNPGREIFPKSSSGIGQGSSNGGGQALSSGSLHISQPQTSIQKTNCSGEPYVPVPVPVPVAKALAETAAFAAANEADSSEASLTREQKLKAERLKRAKMFAAMIKSGSAPSKSETPRGFSDEPPESGVSSSGNQALNLSAKEREGSSIPLEADLSDKVEELEKKLSVDECNERRSRRSYRTKSNRRDGEEGDDDLESEEEEEDRGDHKHLSKKRRSRNSSEHSRDRHKHKRHSSHKDRDSGRRNKHDSSDDEKHRHSRRSRHKKNGSDDAHLPVKRRRHDSSSEEDHRGHKHGSSSEDEHRHRHHHRSVKHRKSEAGKEADLEEGEMYTKSDQSRGSEGDHASREASVDFSNSHKIGRAPSQPSQSTEVSDDLRAKIRAMLMATL